MVSLQAIRQCLVSDRYLLSDHALSRVVERNITAQMIREAAANAEIIEDYPHDKYSPSCLLLGFTHDATALHLHVSRVENPQVKIITLYAPDPRYWIDYRIRKAKP